MSDAVLVFTDGREICNRRTRAGRAEYKRRIGIMWERQGRMCCLHGHLKACPGKLNRLDATFDHEVPRGMGGGSQDDRIEVNGRRQNGAAHNVCNLAKGSRRIDYNAAYNSQIRWDILGDKTTPSGKVLFRCKLCGYETPAPTKNHRCGEVL
jgi:ribosomal protein L44E